jgi:hypothetical protein
MCISNVGKNVEFFSPDRGARGDTALSLLSASPLYSCTPLPPPSPFTPTWFESSSSPPTPSSSTSAPMLNLNELGEPLNFRSALAGPHGDQWRTANGTELIKLVETSRSLTPVQSHRHFPSHVSQQRGEGEVVSLRSSPPRRSS